VEIAARIRAAISTDWIPGGSARPLRRLPLKLAAPFSAPSFYCTAPGATPAGSLTLPLSYIV
jgi:hypothetical protein